MQKLLFTVILVTLFVSALSCNVPSIFSFGDSILDAGNNHYIRNCFAEADFPPYGMTFFHHPTGRFTNGRTVVDFISESIGIDFQEPNLQALQEVVNGSRNSYPSNGINFASGGSGVLQETNKNWRVTPIQEQLQQFQTLTQQNQTDMKLLQQSLFLFESGSNDLFNYFLLSLPNDSDAYVQAMLTEVRNFLDQIYKLGARRIALFGLGPVGCVPARVLLPNPPIDHCHDELNQMVRTYNLGLESMIKDLPMTYPGAVGVYGAVYDIIQLFRAIPNHYDLFNVSSACCGSGTLGGQVQCGKDGYILCQNPDEFLFWDYFHPSEHAYKLISKALWNGNQFSVRPINLQTLANITLTYA